MEQTLIPFIITPLIYYRSKHKYEFIRKNFIRKITRCPDTKKYGYHDYSYIWRIGIFGCYIVVFHWRLELIHNCKIPRHTLSLDHILSEEYGKENALLGTVNKKPGPE